MLLYTAINVVYLRTLPLEQVAATPRIAETAAAAMFGPSGAGMMSQAVVISTFGCLSATILYSPRIYLPMAQDGVFFRGLARVHPKYHTPGRSLWAQSLWGVALTLSGTYEQLYTYVVFAAVVFHILTAGAVFVLRRRRPNLDWLASDGLLAGCGRSCLRRDDLERREVGPISRSVACQKRIPSDRRVCPDVEVR